MAAKIPRFISKARMVIPAICLSIAVLLGLIWADLDARILKSLVVRLASTYLERPVHIDGPVSLSYFPLIRITAGGIRVQNPKDFEVTDFIGIDMLQWQIHPMSMLAGPLKMEPLQVSGMQVRFERNNSGRGNWEISESDTEPVHLSLSSEIHEDADAFPASEDDLDLFSESESPPDATSSGTKYTVAVPISESLLSLISHGMTAKDCRLEYRAARHKLSFTASELHLVPETGGKINTVNLRFRGVAGAHPIGGPRETTIDVTGRAGIHIDLTSGRGSLEDIAISLDETRVEGHIQAKRFFTDDAEFQGKITVVCPDISRLSKHLAEKAGSLPHKQMQMSMGVSLKPGRKETEISGFRARFLGAEVSGNWRMRGRRVGLPEIGGDVHASGPNLPNIILLAAGILGHSAQFSGLEADMNLLTDKPFHLDADFDTDLHGGRIEFRRLQGRGAGIKLNGVFTTHGLFSLMPKAGGYIRIRAEDLPLVLSIADRMSGRGDSDRWRRLDSSALDVDIRMDMDMAWGRIVIPEFRVEGLGLRMDGQLDARKIGTKKASVNGQFSLSHNNLRAFLTAFNRRLRVPLDSDFLKKLKISTEINATRREWVLENIRGQLDDTKVTGRAIIGDPFSQVAVMVDEINLDRYLPTKVVAATPELKNDAIALMRTRLPFRYLKDLDFHADVTVQRMILSDRLFSRVRMGLAAAHGEVTVVPITDE